MSAGENSVLIVGVGNELLGDEGFGVHVVRSLCHRVPSLPANVQVLEAGTCLLDVLPQMMCYSHVLLVDAVRAGGEPGTLYRWEVVSGSTQRWEMACPTSLHEWGLVNTIRTGDMLGLLPPKMTLFGAEPGDLTPGIQLTPRLACAAQRLIVILLEEIAGRHGSGSQNIARPSSAESSQIP